MKTYTDGEKDGEKQTSLLRDITSRTHCNTDVARLQRRSVVHAISCDCDSVVSSCLSLLHDPQLLLGGRACEHDLSVASDDHIPVRSLEQLNIVAGEHKRAVAVLIVGFDVVSFEADVPLFSQGQPHVLEAVDLLLRDDVDLQQAG